MFSTLTSIVPRILWLNVVFCSKNSRLTCISYSCECLVDITSCILAEDESKLDADHTISPLKEPLKKKGNDITNPYPNFKVCTHHTTETNHVDQLLWFLHFAFDNIYQTQKSSILAHHHSVVKFLDFIIHLAPFLTDDGLSISLVWRPWSFQFYHQVFSFFFLALVCSKPYVMDGRLQGTDFFDLSVYCSFWLSHNKDSTGLGLILD